MSAPLLDPSRPGAPADPPVTAADLRPVSPDWERPPDRAPLLRWRAAGTALLLVLVAAAAWWAVRWLTSPVPPSVAGPSAAAPAATAPASPGVPGVPAAPSAAAGADAGASAGTAASAAGSDPAAADPSGPAGGPGAATGPAVLRVHVVGQVRRPGVVELTPGARVSDAVAAAGGASGDARTDRINLAAPVADGQQVVVPDADTDLTPDTAGPGAAADAAAGPGSTDSSTAGGTGGAAAAPGDDRVDLNTADAAALETLPGVGPATAEKIIDHRQSVGPYTGLQDLDAVPGIGPATLDRLADHVTW